MSSRRYIEDLFRRTLARVDVASSMAGQIGWEGGVLRVGELQYRMDDYEAVSIVSIGKAAIPMVDALLKVVAPRLRRNQLFRGIVVSNSEPHVRFSQLHYTVGGHPTPDAASRAAGRDILKHLRECDERTLVFFLISGGASAMVEMPLGEAISILDTALFYKALVHSGLPITKMNCVRKHLSAVKGGRLAEAAYRSTQCSIIISDVPEGSLDMVGSGPSMPDTSTVEECRRILAEGNLASSLPTSVRTRLLASDLPETAKPNGRAFARARYACLLSNANLLLEAGRLAAGDGFHVVTDNSCDDLGYEEAGAYLLDRMRDLSARHGKICLLSGGEVSVRLPEVVGVGGRNQQFALWCALRLRASGEAITVLSAGTDGVDGNSPAAGAYVDWATCDEGGRRGLDAAASLRCFDSYTFFEGVGAALMTGPTGNNIRDLRILLSNRDEARHGPIISAHKRGP